MQGLIKFIKNTTFAPALYAPVITVLMLIGWLSEKCFGNDHYATVFFIVAMAAAVATGLALSTLLVLYRRDTTRIAGNS